jgi:hypothetical protein
LPRGGRRSGQPGKAYKQRSDLNGPQPVADYAGPKVPYGTGAELTRSQQQMPVSGPQAPGPSQGPAPGPGGGQPSMQAAPPGSWGNFTRDSERPDEPLTHGLSRGPGGGPEVLGNVAGRPALTLIQQLAAQPYASDEMRNLLNLLQ